MQGPFDPWFGKDRPDILPSDGWHTAGISPEFHPVFFLLWRYGEKVFQVYGR